MPVRQLFPSLIYEHALSAERGFDAFNAELLAACYMLADEDEAGKAWCEAKDYDGYTSYGSLSDLPRRATIFADLKARLDLHVGLFCKALHLDFGGQRPKLVSLWVNVLDPGGSHSGHIHPRSIISGTVYVSTPDGAGGLRFEDPRLPLMMARPSVAPTADEAQRNFVMMRPKPGDLFLWESFLRHEVMPHRGEEPRVSVSFNYG